MAPPQTFRDDRQPDSAALWRWVWASSRPYLGYILTAIGFLALIIGYLGVSREIYVGRQVPYIVSGGLVGVAFISLGSRLLLIEDLRRDSGRLDRLEKAVTELHQALLIRPDAPIPGYSAMQQVNGQAVPSKLVVVPGGESFHRPECPVLEGKASKRSVTPETAQRRGLHACPLCQPLVAGV
jgi:hypothetical protein